MSVRYGILLVPEPSFTARVYRARQLICGQYGAWAAEMQMVHLPVSGFFQCTDRGLGALESGLDELAARSRRDAPQFQLSHSGVASNPDHQGNIFLDFARDTSRDTSTESGPAPLDILRDSVVSFLDRTPEVTHDPLADGPTFRPHLPLVQFARLPHGVFSDAVEFAQAAVAGLGVPDTTRAWRLLLLRFHSEAAGDDWSGGGWALDLRWEPLSSHRL